MWCICTTISFSHKKKGSSDSCYNIGGPWRYAKWNKPDRHKRQTVRFHLYEVSRKGKFIDTKGRLEVTKVSFKKVYWVYGWRVTVGWIQSFCSGWWEIFFLYIFFNQFFQSTWKKDGRGHRLVSQTNLVIAASYFMFTLCQGLCWELLYILPVILQSRLTQWQPHNC